MKHRMKPSDMTQQKIQIREQRFGKFRFYQKMITNLFSQQRIQHLQPIKKKKKHSNI